MTLLKFVIFPFEVVKTSISLPGVATTISQPLLSSESYPLIPVPPYIATILNPCAFVKGFASKKIYIANSLVGTKIKPIGPSPSSKGL